jgi:hypothetical protein
MMGIMLPNWQVVQRGRKEEEVEEVDSIFHGAIYEIYGVFDK